MDQKKAANVLINLLNKNTLDVSEKEAIRTAIGVLSWTYLSKNRIKKLKDKRKKSIEW